MLNVLLDDGALVLLDLGLRVLLFDLLLLGAHDGGELVGLLLLDFGLDLLDLHFFLDDGDLGFG